MTQTVSWRRRVMSHGVVRHAGRFLLVPAGDGWTLPGGQVGHGESPQAALTRSTVRQTGLSPRVGSVRWASADQAPLPDGAVLHTDRLVFDAVAPPGVDPGPTAHWFAPGDLAGLTLPGFAAAALGLDPASVTVGQVEEPVDGWRVERGMAQDGHGRTLRVQRFSAYARATGPDGRILFAKIATGYPSAGRWHLPGGGTDVGESPADALLREVAEETGQVGTVGRLITVSHRHNPVARGWEGYPINWHTIRVVYEMTVDRPTEPRVTEAAGSTAEAAWMRPAEVDRRFLTDLAAAMLRPGPID